jgi:hypothetical protein
LRPFTEPALSEILQSLLSFRMTANEGCDIKKTFSAPQLGLIFIDFLEKIHYLL